MKIVSALVQIWNVHVLLVLFCSFTSSYIVSDDFGSRESSSIAYKYDRIDEVKKECKSVLLSASELKPYDSREYSIKSELSIINGDWEQEVAGAPLLPFDNGDVVRNATAHRSLVNFVSFWVTDIDRAHRSEKYVSVNGALSMGITLDGNDMATPYQGSPQFHMWPSHSDLSIIFQGIYTESEENGGERVMCLLGNALLPMRRQDSSDPWEGLNNSGVSYNQPHLLQDDQVMLVLRYPKKLTLTSMAIRGEMKSLNKKSNPKYFDPIHISSQLDSTSSYEFSSEKIVSKACDPYPYKDNLKNNDIEVYNGSEFCSILKQYTRGEAFTIIPNWRCNVTTEYCSKLGPFVSNQEIKATNGGFKDVKLSMQRVRCEQTSENESKVSAVFRAVPPSENFYYAGQKSGLNNMTLAAEGIWRASSGQLCMVGCLGIGDAEGNYCDSRICLYIPLSFSIKQRSIFVGSISSINSQSPSYFPLSFEKLVQPTELWERFQTTHLRYKYSKIEAAGIILERDEPFSFRTVIKKSLLKFPKLEDSYGYMSSLSLLSEDLTLHISAVPDSTPVPRAITTEVQMEIVSVGPLFGRYWYYRNGSTTEEESPYHTQAEYTEQKILLNVSAQLSLSGVAYKNYSVLFLEGLYDPHVGKMYAVGCRDVRASWEILYESMDLEAGLDCSIEVVVSYPPTTSRWLVNPTSRISITSQRNDDDPLLFSPIKLQTLPMMYRRQREDVLSRRGVEGILRILTLSLAIACILSQIMYIRDNVDSVPYMSLVMLGVQALGYSLPLVTGAEALFKKVASESYENPSYDIQKNQWFHVIDYTVKLLVLTSFLMTLRLWQKVWKSRIRLLTRTPLEPLRVPNDKWVLVTTFIFHLIGYIVVLILHSMKNSQRPLQTNTYMDSTGNSHRVWEWATELEEYVGLVQDFFLLPQIIGNLKWQIHCRPLRNLYFIGITAVRLLPHVYDYIRDPIPNPYFSEDYEFVNPSLDFFSKFGDIAIPVTAVLLAVLVYIQQRWNYEKLSQALTLGKHRLLPLGSKMYQRLPSKVTEAELVTGVNEDTNSAHEHDREE